MLLVFEGFQYVFQVYLGRGRWLCSCRFRSECFYLFEVLIKLSICFVDVSLFDQRSIAEFLL